MYVAFAIMSAYPSIYLAVPLFFTLLNVYYAPRVYISSAYMMSKQY